MFHRKRSASRRKQRGSMLLISIFILTVMIFLAVSLQDVFSAASRSLAYEVYGTRALSAANAGAELALQKIFYLQGQTPLVFSDVEPNPATASLNLDLSTTEAFAGCSVAVAVSRFTINDATHFYNYTHYRIESTATCIAGDFKTVRTVSVEGRER